VHPGSSEIALLRSLLTKGLKYALIKSCLLLTAPLKIHIMISMVHAVPVNIELCSTVLTDLVEELHSTPSHLLALIETLARIL